MATNEILRFAETDTGTNLLTQAEYQSDAQRTIGHQPGIARSKLENKALRQASLLVAGMAQYMADRQSADIIDSLTPAQIATYLYDAINAEYLALNGSNEMAARLRARAGAPGAGNPNNCGVVFDNANGNGLYSPSVNQLALAIAGTPIAIWVQNMKSLGTSGWLLTPSGVIFQWCRTTYTNPGGLGTTVTFGRTYPIAFPTATMSINVSSFNSNDDGTEHIIETNADRFGFTGTARRVYGVWTGDTVTVQALAVGY